MKRFAGIVSLAALMFVVFSCADNSDFSLRNDDNPVITISAAVEQCASTKTELNDALDIVWTAGDGISLMGDGINYEFRTSEAQLKDGGISADFSHEGDIPHQDYFAVYPYNSSATCDGSYIVTELPTEQTAVAGSFGQGANLAVAYAAWGRSFKFKNLAAMVRVSFKTATEGAHIRKITFRSIDESVLLSGTVKITPEVASRTLSNVDMEVTSGVPYVTLSAPEGSDLSPETEYYIAVAPAALSSGYVIEFENEEGLVFSKTYDAASNKATLLRNTVSPTGRKNFDNYEMPFEAYWRVTNVADFTEGDYLLGYDMGNGNIRFFDESKTDCYISSGTPLVEKFSNVTLTQLGNAWSTWKKGGEAPTIMRHYVLWAFRNAYVDTDSGTSVTGFTYSGADMIINPNDNFKLLVDASSTLTMKLGYNSGGQQYKDVQMSSCSLTLDQSGNAKIIGRITEASISNLVDIFYISKGSAFTVIAPKSDALTAAKQACNKDTTVGFCTTEQTTAAGDKMNNMFMIQNYHLCNSPAPQGIWLYKKGTKAISYSKYKNL